MVVILDKFLDVVGEDLFTLINVLSDAQLTRVHLRIDVQFGE